MQEGIEIRSVLRSTPVWYFVNVGSEVLVVEVSFIQ
jgi:hypothetical protein